MIPFMVYGDTKLVCKESGAERHLAKQEFLLLHLTRMLSHSECLDHILVVL